MRSTRYLPTLGIFGGAAFLYGIFIARTSFVFQGERYFTLIDDAMISMRFARNLAGGDGLVWNPGQDAVEGYTNFLWVLVMAVPHLLGFDKSVTSLFMQVICMALLLGTGWVSCQIASRLGQSRLVVLAVALLVLFYYPLVFWTLRGMETGASAFLVTLSVLLSLRLKAEFRSTTLALQAVVMVLSLLVRTDAVVVAAPVALLAGLMVDKRYRTTTILVLFLAIGATLIGHTVFRLVYYGDAFPNTYYLKVEGIALTTRLERGVLAFLDTSRVHLYAPLLIVAAHWLVARKRWDATRYLLVVPFVVSSAYSVYVGGDAWEWWRHSNRYLSQAVPLLLIMTMIALDDMVRSSAEQRMRWIKLVAAGLGIVFLANLHTGPIDLLQVWETGRPTLALRMLPILGLIAFVLLLPRLLTRMQSLRFGSPPALAVAGFVVLLLFSMGLEPFGHWAKSNAYHLGEDVAWASYGLGIERTTEPGAVIAVQAAGQIPYFSERESIDLLGKNDRHIAHLPPANDDPFRPGHNKWDLAYSIGQEQPDYVAQLFHFHLTEEETDAVLSYGYELVEGDCIVKRDTDVVDIAGLRALLETDPQLAGRVCIDELGGG